MRAATIRRHEHATAAGLGTTRTARCGESRPDVGIIVDQNGNRYQAEVKTRSRLPHLLTFALDQAQRYSASAIPIAVIRRAGLPGGVVCLSLTHFAAVVGLDVDELPKAKPLRRVDARQVALPGIA